MKSVRELAKQYPNTAQAAKAAGVFQSQMQRWLDADALMTNDGTAWTPAGPKALESFVFTVTTGEKK